MLSRLSRGSPAARPPMPGWAGPWRERRETLVLVLYFLYFYKQNIPSLGINVNFGKIFSFWKCICVNSSSSILTVKDDCRAHSALGFDKSKSCHYQKWLLHINIGTPQKLKICPFKKLAQPFEKPIFQYFHTLKITFTFCITYLRKSHGNKSFAIFLKQN